MATALAALPLPVLAQATPETRVAPAASPFAVDLGSPALAVPSSPRPDVRLGGFFGVPFDGGFQPAGDAGAPQRAYEIIPSLTTSVQATDNVALTTRNRRSELITSISPALRVIGSTARLQGSFAYAPSFDFYANDTQPNRVAHRFIGSGTAAILPEVLFLDVRAFGTLSPLAPGLNDGTVLPGTRTGLTQTYSASISPYYIQRFGGWATSIIGYQYQYSSRQASVLRLTPGGELLTGPDDTSSHIGYAAVRSGENFGRLAMEARVSATTTTGGGPVTEGSRRYLGTVEARYALTRMLFVLGEIGYESQRFGGTTPFRAEGPTWGAGVRIDPGPDSTITLRYRRQDGFNSPQVDARFGLGPRTVLFGRYQEEVTTSARQTADLLNNISLDAFGNPVDRRTGAPTPELGGGGFLSTQNGLFRSRRGVVSVTHFRERDSFTLQLSRDQRNPISVNPGQLALAQETQGVSLIWQRPLSEVTNLFVSGGYNWNRSRTLGSRSETLSARAGLAHQFGERLSGNLLYQFTQRVSSQAGAAAGVLAPQNATQNTVIGSLTLRF